MNDSDLIASGALVVPLSVAAFTAYQHLVSRRAKLEFKMSIGRSYSINPDGVVLKENNPTTRLMIRNLGSRPSAILMIKAKNPAGSILMDIDKKPPGELPLSLAPWDVKILNTIWPAGDHTEDMYFVIRDLDDKEYKVHDYTSNTRILVGENVRNNIE